MGSEINRAKKYTDLIFKVEETPLHELRDLKLETDTRNKLPCSSEARSRIDRGEFNMAR